MTRVVAVLLAVVAAAPAAAEDLAIVGAKVHLKPGTVVDGATIVIRGGKIAAVGAGLPVPAGARRLDAAGKVVTAGFIDASSRVGLVEVELEASARDGTFEVQRQDDDVIFAAYRVTDGFNAASVAIPVARSGGVTSVVVVPSGGLISGASAWYALAERAPLVLAPAGMHAALGLDGAPATRGSRGLAALRLREVLDDAAAYARNKAAYERNASRRLAAERLDLEALQPVLAGRIPLVISANHDTDIRAALTLARERRIRVVIAGGVEAWRVAAELAQAKVPVILNPMDNLPSSFDQLFVRDDAAAILAKAGVDVAVSTLGGASSARTLRQLAGVAVANGLPWDRALAALTTVPARIFGVADRGEIRPGAAADLVVWSGDPLELTSQAETVVVGGAVQPADSHQTKLLGRYRTLK